MSTCDKRDYTEEELRPLLEYVIGNVNSLIHEFASSYPTDQLEAKVDGLETIKVQSITFDKANVKPCPPSCGCSTAALEIKDATVVLGAPKIKITKGVSYSASVKVTLEEVTVKLETNCKSKVKITKLTFDDLEITSDGFMARIALTQLPDQTKELKRLIKQYIVDQELTLPVRVGAGLQELPILCK
jgi:hypothetical protein